MNKFLISLQRIRISATDVESPEKLVFYEISLVLTGVNDNTNNDNDIQIHYSHMVDVAFEADHA